MSIRISLAKYEDIPALNKLVHNCYRAEESGKGWTTEKDMLDGTRTTEQQLTKDMSAPNATYLKCEDENGTLIGCVCTVKEFNKLHAGLLCVRPDLQARGIGRQLMAGVEALARDEGCVAVQIDVISIRHSLIAWYERMGFVKTGKSFPFAFPIECGKPKEPLELCIFEKNL